jgi:hypothetical protein
MQHQKRAGTATGIVTIVIVAITIGIVVIIIITTTNPLSEVIWFTSVLLWQAVGVGRFLGGNYVTCRHRLGHERSNHA